MKNYLHNFGIPNISKYYLLGVLLWGIFPMGNWVFYFAEYMDIRTIGIIDGISILIGVLAEIPTGALSDLLGKKKTLLIGYVLMFIGSAILARASEVAQFFSGNIVFFIGFAFITGAQEALGYDSLFEQGLQEKFARVSSVYGVLTIGSLLVTLGLGGLAFDFSPRLPWILYAVFMAVAVIVTLTLREPAVDTEKFTLRNYLRQTARGGKALFSAKLRRVIILILLIAGITEMGQGLIRQASGAYFGFDGVSFGYLMSFTTLLATIIVFRLDKVVELFGEFKFLVLMVLAIVTAYIISYFTDNIYAGVIVFSLLAFAGRVSVPFISIMVNHRIESRDRATTLSTLSLLKQIPYIVTVTFFGYLAQLENIRDLYLIILAITVVVGSVGVFIDARTK